MIRKILLFISLAFVITWFSVAYLLKSKVLLLIENSRSDNVKISYDEIQISGFPSLWKIKLVTPKITIIDHNNSKEISSQEMICTFDLSFKKAKINFGYNIKQERNFVNKVKIYVASSDQAFEALLKFNKSLFKIYVNDNLYDNLKELKFNNELISIANSDERIFDIKDLSLSLNKSFVEQSYSENIQMKFHASYNRFVSQKISREELHKNYTETYSLIHDLNPESENNKDDLSNPSHESKYTYRFLNFDYANLDINTIFNVFNSKNNRPNIKNFTINHLKLTFDDSNITVSGTMEFLQNIIPKGKLSFIINNYDKAIDKFNNPFFSNSIVKRMILEAARSSINYSDQNNIDLENTDNVKFNIESSDYGIKLGEINLIKF